MTIDYLAVIAAESTRLGQALDADRSGRIPWSDTWTVAQCVHHVAGAHHVVAEVIAGRPTADFGLFATLARPDVDDPGLGAWLTEGTEALVTQLRATDPHAECWSWWPEGRDARFWARRMGQETLVHRWDAEAGAGVDPEPMDPALAADGLDEYLDVFVGINRVLHTAPAGPSVHVHCTDTDGEWLITLPAPGERVLTREHAKGDIALRGGAEALLLTMWGRLTPAAAGIDVAGDASVLEQWTTLFPSM